MGMGGLTLIVGSIVLLLGLSVPIPTSEGATTVLKNSGKQTWGYVQVRPGAFMFWWLHFTSASVDYTKKPLVLWLQGGPGGSSTGFGNFEEIGPLDINLEPRAHSWVNHTNVLFVDNPVGSGFSYVTDLKLLSTNNTQITNDLIELMSKFLQKVPEFQTVPLYIFSESYGGKMAAQFALRLQKQILKGKIKCNLKGVNLGDSWISPVDSVLTWAPFLFSTSMVDNAGFALVNESAYLVKAALDNSEYVKATELWDKTEGVIDKCTNGVNVYNILETDKGSSSASVVSDTAEALKLKNTAFIPSVTNIISKLMKSNIIPEQIRTNTISKAQAPPVEPAPPSTAELTGMAHIGAKHLSKYHSDPLEKLMNGQIKQMLRVIPENVTWGGQSTEVFAALSEDFMKPVVRIVEALLNNTPIEVNVYSGQLDLIVDTMGTIKWVERMKWPGIPFWKLAKRTPVIIHNSTEIFVKSFKNLGFYWILKAGHMVPADAPQTAVEMLQIITKLKPAPTV